MTLSEKVLLTLLFIVTLLTSTSVWVLAQENMKLQKQVNSYAPEDINKLKDGIGGGNSSGYSWSVKGRGLTESWGHYEENSNEFRIDIVRTTEWK